jgi:hypothetical protein
MPRVIVTTDPSRIPKHVAVLLDERVHTLHLSDDHGAAGLIERIAWAISDAEDAEEAAPPTRSAAPQKQERANGGKRSAVRRREPPRRGLAAVPS